MSSILEIINIVSSTNDDMVRQENEGKILHKLDSNTQGFISECVTIINNSSHNETTRVTAALVLIASLTKTNSQGNLFWHSLDDNYKN